MRGYIDAIHESGATVAVDLVGLEAQHVGESKKEGYLFTKPFVVRKHRPSRQGACSIGARPAACGRSTLATPGDV